MIHLLIQASKYIMLLFMLIYSFECFHVFRYRKDSQRERIYNRQRILIYLIHLNGYLILYLRAEDPSLILGLYLMEVVIMLFLQLIYHRYYKLASDLVLNNMCMLFTTGMIMLPRLSMRYALRQIVFLSAGAVIAVLIPMVTGATNNMFRRMTPLYIVIGIGSLAAVIFGGNTTYGAMLSLTIGEITFQPSEFVKIIFVFFVAGMLYKDHSFKRVFLTSVIAAVFVLLLVYARDLGGALIYFFAYLMIVFAASGNILYLAAGGGLMGTAGMIGYRLFAHVRTRVIAWRDPVSVIDTAGYQVSQSLFGIGMGGWLGMGLTLGNPDAIPVAAKDYIFPAIAEECGGIFAICVVLVYISCFLMIFNIAMQLEDVFYKLAAVGLGSAFSLQIFLNVGGVTKFIPSTGVTLPLISYGGSSLLSTMLLFGIIQGFYIHQFRTPRRKKGGHHEK